MKFAVPIVYKGLANFIVDAKDENEAKVKAAQAFNNGEHAESFGNEWEKIDQVCDPEVL